MFLQFFILLKSFFSKIEYVSKNDRYSPYSIQEKMKKLKI